MQTPLKGKQTPQARRQAAIDALTTPQGSASRSAARTVGANDAPDALVQGAPAPPSFESLRCARIVSMARRHLQSHRRSMADASASSGRSRLEVARSALHRSCAVMLVDAQPQQLRAVCDPSLRSAVVALGQSHDAAQLHRIAASAAVQATAERLVVAQHRATARRERASMLAACDAAAAAANAATTERSHSLFSHAEAADATGGGATAMSVCIAEAVAAARLARCAAAAAAGPPRARLGAADTAAAVEAQGVADSSAAAKRARSDSGRAWPIQRPLGWTTDASSSVDRATSPNSRALHDLRVLRTRYEQCRRELAQTKAELAKALAAGERWRVEALSAAKREAEWRLRANAVAEAAATEVAAAVSAAREILRSVEAQRAGQSPSRASAIANRGGGRSTCRGVAKGSTPPSPA